MRKAGYSFHTMVKYISKFVLPLNSYLGAINTEPTFIAAVANNALYIYAFHPVHI
jgi:hypothetical protein